MSFEISWDAVPAKRQKKVEKYSTPVLTLVAVDPEKKGAGRKMIFNKAAQEALGVVGEERVSFGFAKATKQVFLKKAVAPQGFELTKTCTLSDKKTFEFILENFGLNEELENEFDIVPSAVVTGAMELTPKASFAAEPVIEFHTTNVGEVSDEENTSGDLSGIPATPEGGVVYEAGIDPIVEESPEPSEEIAHTPGVTAEGPADEAPFETEEEEMATAPAPEPVAEATASESEEEDEW